MTSPTRTPAAARRSIQRVLLSIRDFMVEKDKCTHMVVGGYLLVNSDQAALRLTNAYRGVVEAAIDARANEKVRSLLAATIALNRLLALHKLLRVVDGNAEHELEVDDPHGVTFHKQTLVTWTFAEELSTIIVELESIAKPPSVQKVADPLHERESLVLEILENARVNRSGRGVTAPELWSELPRVKRVSEDRIRRIIRGLRDRGVPIPNAGNRGGYVLGEPLASVRARLGIPPYEPSDP